MKNLEDYVLEEEIVWNLEDLHVLFRFYFLIAGDGSCFSSVYYKYNMTDIDFQKIHLQERIQPTDPSTPDFQRHRRNTRRCNGGTHIMDRSNPNNS
jgi:hypothetical protein